MYVLIRLETIKLAKVIIFFLDVASQNLRRAFEMQSIIKWNIYGADVKKKISFIGEW